MEKYNYYEAIYDDVKEYGLENIELSDYYDEEDNSFNLSELSDKLNDSCWIDDSVTGNASGSYTCNAWQAEENLSHNWDLTEEAVNEGFEPNDRCSPEAWDVCIRCYLLGQVVAEVCEELEEDVRAEYGEDVVIW